MKTAEEWKQIWLKLECNTMAEHEANATHMIKQIQLDAAKWGAEQAANVLRKKMDDDYRVSFSTALTTVSDFAANLTLNDLPK